MAGFIPFGSGLNGPVERKIDYRGSIIIGPRAAMLFGPLAPFAPGFGLIQGLPLLRQRVTYCHRSRLSLRKHLLLLATYLCRIAGGEGRWSSQRQGHPL